MKELIIDLLLEADKEKVFLPKGINIQQYVDKLFQHAVILPVIEHGKLIAVVAFYCNDLVNKKGFVTLIAASPGIKRKGIGRFLLGMAIHFMEVSGFKEVEGEIYKNNIESLRLAEKLGFSIKADKGELYIVHRELK